MLLSVAELRENFSNLHRVQPRPWQVIEELHLKPPQTQRLWLSWWIYACLGLQAGLKEDWLHSVLTYQHERGKLLYFEYSLALTEHVFHNLTRLIDILNVFFERDDSLMLHKLLLGSSGEGEGEGEGFRIIAVPSPGQDPLRATQLQHYVEGFLLHGLLPTHVIWLLLRAHIHAQQDLQLLLELLEKMRLLLSQ